MTFDTRSIGFSGGSVPTGRGGFGSQLGSGFVSDPSISIGQGGITGKGTIGGVPIDVTIPLGGGVPDNSGVTAPGTPGGQSLQADGGCKPGTIRVGDRCVAPGDIFPGGDPFIEKATNGSTPAQMGVFGLLSVAPAAIGEIRGRPVLRCPHAGLVLGKDNRCYSKKDLPRKLRKWPPRRACKGPNERRLDDLKKAGSAAKALRGAFKGTGFKITKSGR